MIKEFFKLTKPNIEEIVTANSISLVLIVCLVFSFKFAFNVYAKFMFRNTYIAKISTPSYGEYTKIVLEEFNAMGQNKIISFDKKKNGRPIEIVEMADIMEELQPEVLGMAYPATGGCTIFVKKKQFWMDYRETLIHEYLHCMGYDHSANRNDLMYKYLIPVDKEINIRYYANELRKKYYE